jgi:pilus assembly protein CpaE
MNPSLSILIINPDEASTRSLKSVLAEIKGVVLIGQTADLTAGFQQIKKVNPDVVVLSLSPAEEPALQLAEKISHNYADTTLFVTASQAKPDLILRAMRSGAREFWLQPFRMEELSAGIQTARRLKKQTEPQSVSAKIITVFGVKGGVGSTTLATNLAVSLSQRTQKEVLLLDTDFQFGQAALFLNCKPRYTALDLAGNLDSVEPELVKKSLPQSAAGVYFLGGPPNMEDAEAIKATHMEQMLTLLRGLFHYLVIDTSPALNDLTLRLLDESDLILLIANFDVPSFYSAKKCLDLFQRLGYEKDKVHLLMNRYAAHEVLDLEAVEKSIGYPIFWKIPNQEYSLVIRSINEGEPLSLSQPKCRFSLNLLEMLDRFNGTLNASEPSNEVKAKSPLIRRILSPWNA